MLLCVPLLDHVLHPVKDLWLDDCLVVVFNKVLRNLAVVYHLFFRKEVRRVGLLEQGTALVLLILQDALNGALRPFVLSGRGLDAQLSQLFSDCPVGKSLKELPEYELDGLRLLRVYCKVPVLALIVAEETAVSNRHLAVRHPFAMPPGDVLGNAPAFLLRKAGHDGYQEFAFAVERPDVFFFKVALGSVCLQVPDGGKAVHRVPGETADALRYDEVDLARHRVGDHSLKALALFSGSTRDAFVRVHPCELPVIMAFDQRGVVIQLRLVTGKLLIMVGGNAGVACHLPLNPAVDRCRCVLADRCRDLRYILWHSALPPSFSCRFP